MRKLILLFLLTSNYAFSQQGQRKIMPDSVKYVLDTSVQIIKTRSYQKNLIRKSDIKKVYKLANDAQTVKDLKQPIEFLFKKTEDYHGWFQYDTLFFQWRNRAIKTPEPTEAISKGFQQPNTIATELIDGNIGYLKIRFIKKLIL